ncbi:type II toxin-antitoxin system VapC family toxin [Rhizobium sp. PP-CC-3G-465]|uniref:type II toxin-antitoxin system VapC family toxin n=1 Tax=Rhizobium sp. PP-CC-3G-465 TaxID=2135648 RepID=UPI001049735C|nr:putative nucleic acid-binding protein [Rhizobium sp. PP-CC-3G-465]
MTGGPRIYLDTNSFIFAIEEASVRSDLLNALFDISVRGSNQLLVTSELALAELLVKPFRTGMHDLVRRYDDVIRTDTWLDVYPVNRAVLWRAAELRSVSKLKIADSIHFSTAQITNCTHFMTADGDFASLSALPLPTGMLPPARIAIVRPDIPTLTTLLESLSP